MQSAFTPHEAVFAAHSSTSAQLPGAPEYPGAHAQVPSELQTEWGASSDPAPSHWG
jgi:hypothetical protein